MRRLVGFTIALALTVLTEAKPSNAALTHTSPGTTAYGASVRSSFLRQWHGSTPARLGLPSSGTLGSWTINGTSETITGEIAVPDPLPLLGVGAAFEFSRRLRQRIQSRQVYFKS